jgi:HSP20 family molecular chaperone IbpA
MARIEHTIEVNVPLHAVYNQWTQFEQFPRFMEDVQEVRQLDDAHLHWRAHRHGSDVEWNSEIVDQVPDSHIAWRDTGGPGNSGKVNFFPVGEDKTRVQLVMEYEPEVPSSEVAEAELLTMQRIEQDLARFKRLVEAQDGDSGAWRGEIHFAQPALSPESAQPSHGGAASGGGQARAIDESKEGQSIFAQQTSPDPGETPSAAATDSSGRTPADRQTRGDADPRTASLDNSTGTVGATGAGAHQQTGGQRSGAAAGQDRQNSGSANQHSERDDPYWIPNMLNGFNEPKAMVRRVGEEVEQLFERFIGRPVFKRNAQGSPAGKWNPEVEVCRRGDTLHVCIDLPGVSAEDVSVEAYHGKLVVEGERRDERRNDNDQDDGDDDGLRRSERSYGKFHREIALPPGADPDAVRASMQDGVLEIQAPLPARRQPGRRVDIARGSTTSQKSGSGSGPSARREPEI